MTSRERVLAALQGRPVDRLPHYDPFVDGFPAKWRAARQPPAEVSIDEYYGNDLGIPTADETLFFSRAEVLDRTPDGCLRRDGWGRVLRERTGRAFYEVVENIATDPDHFASAPFDDPADDRRYASFERQLAHCADRQLAGFVKIGGPFLRTTFWRGETTFLMDIAADPDFARLLADRMADHLLAIALESLRRSNNTQLGVSMWDDIAHNRGLFMSTASFERIFLPGYARIVAACKAAGAHYFFFHSDGDIRRLLPYLAEIGVDLINPVEPRAGMDVIQLAREYRGRLQFIGGIDNSGVICFGTPDEVRAHTAPIAHAARHEGGLIVGMHSVETDVPIENYEAYWDTVMAH